MPLLDITKPRNVMLVTLNLHLQISTYSLASQSFYKTIYIQCQCSFLVLEKIKTSLIYAKQKSSKQSIRIVLIYCQKVAGLLQSLKGKTTGLKELYLIQKAAYSIDLYSTQIQLKAQHMSNLINNNKLANQLSVLEISSRGYQSFLVKVLSCQQLI